MLSSEYLRQKLRRIDRKGYKVYKEISGAYDFRGFVLHIDHVQGDPFATPSRLRICVSQKTARFPEELYSNAIRCTALEDYLTRSFHAAIRRHCKGNRGIGHSGLIGILAPGQEVLVRTSALVTGEAVEARIVMGLPAAGRTILGREAEEMFFNELPKLVESALNYRNLRADQLAEHVRVVEDQEALRQELDRMGLVAFVANGAVLPRRSGIDDRPLVVGDSGDTPLVLFQSPPSLEVEMMPPSGRLVRGMGIPRGITLIVGGGFHGKSTLMNALARGIYNYVPGDGREEVVCLPDAVQIRAEDGRRIEKVDISPFIRNLPFGKDTSRFCTDNASGSTSQASNIMEALEMGARLLLIDEDTSATNFMIRDERMQELVAKEKEPITPFVDKVRQLYDEYGVSTILVMGGSGDYFDVAHTVLMMDDYMPQDVTQRATEIITKHRTRRKAEGGEHFGRAPKRRVDPESFDPSRGRREVKIDVRTLDNLAFGRTPVDLSAVEQLIHIGQTRTIGEIILYFSRRYAGHRFTLHEGLHRVMDDIHREGLDVLSPGRPGNLAMVRSFEVASAINRMRTLRVLDEGE
ncbi:MAG: ABC-ATPase domain-containing protein [Deltaproteobacteria bacterium]|nr:ABC-ATPase domain-containing protein [Deltaproteobacteria bacterium]